MKRLAFYLMAALLGFGVGIATSMIYKLPLVRTPEEVMNEVPKLIHQSTAGVAFNQGPPLRLTREFDDHKTRKFKIENVDSKPVVSYTIGFDNLRSEEWMFSQMTAGEEETYALEPGGSDEQCVYAQKDEWITAWVDFVEFADGTTWGPKLAKTAGSLKEDGDRTRAW